MKKHRSDGIHGINLPKKENKDNSITTFSLFYVRHVIKTS